MPHEPQHQFDPVAASAIAAINSTQRAQRTLRQQAGLPEPPGVEGAFNQSRTVLSQLSSMSPLNMLGSQGGPQLPGFGGQGAQGGPMGLPSPQQLLPGQMGAGAAGGIPTPDQLLPGMGGQQAARGASGRRRRQTNANANGKNGNGASKTEESKDPGRRSEDSRS
ncbi:MAG: hypothetical protein BRD38_04040 [Bacteroidetes bacterium QH_9_67_14]|nr:MAG: hypothetical protein BRD38_04040 [Bacteroidetes bacterium QH_9_67_14]